MATTTIPSDKHLMPGFQYHGIVVKQYAHPWDPGGDLVRARKAIQDAGGVITYVMQAWPGLIYAVPVGKVNPLDPNFAEFKDRYDKESVSTT